MPDTRFEMGASRVAKFKGFEKSEVLLHEADSDGGRGRAGALPRHDADHQGYTPEYQKLYGKRKETIERVFADAKEKHAMRYTQYRGLAQVTNWVKLKFAAMNLKKLAKWKWNDHFRLLLFRLFCSEHERNPVAA